MDSDSTGFVLTHSCVEFSTSVVLQSCVLNDNKNAEVGDRERFKIVNPQHCEMLLIPMRVLGIEPDTSGL